MAAGPLSAPAPRRQIGWVAATDRATKILR